MELNWITYGRWHLQRIRRWWRGDRLPSPHIIRRVDRLRDRFHIPDTPMGTIWCEVMVQDHMVTHLPHRATCASHPSNSIFDPSVQESWCAQHVGMWDQDWLYMGQNKWAFRTQDHAVQFHLMWS
jgi:hypothetical protein